MFPGDTESNISCCRLRNRECCVDLLRQMATEGDLTGWLSYILTAWHKLNSFIVFIFHECEY